MHYPIGINAHSHTKTCCIQNAHNNTIHKRKPEECKKRTAHMSFNWDRQTTRGLPRWCMLSSMTGENALLTHATEWRNLKGIMLSWRWDINTCCMIQCMSNVHDRQRFSDRSRHTVGTGGDCQCVDSFQGSAENDYNTVNVVWWGWQDSEVTRATELYTSQRSWVWPSVLQQLLDQGDDQSHREAEGPNQAHLCLAGRLSTCPPAHLPTCPFWTAT